MAKEKQTEEKQVVETEERQIKMVVEKNDAGIESKPASKINPEIIEKLKETIDEKTEELENKKYLIPGGKEVAKSIKQFIVKQAKWKFTESLGIVEINRQMHEFINDPASKELMVPPLVLEAFYYFLSKHEGIGLPEADAFVSLLKAINQAKSRADNDKKELEEMRFRLQSLEHGVDPDNPEEQFKDQEIEVK